MTARCLFVVSCLALAACSPRGDATREASSAREAPASASGSSVSSAPDEAPTPPATDVPVARQVQASATQCHEGERALYNCPFGDGRVVSLCAGEGYAYRFGPLGRPELVIARAVGEAGIWKGTVVGQGGGQQTHVRFRQDGYDYIVFSGYDGSLADHPGREYSGVTVFRGDREVRRLDCPVASSQTQIPASMIPMDIPDETRGGPFDGWL